VHKEASRAGQQPEVVLALLQVESHFNQYAVSSAGLRSMMQIVPFWKQKIGRPDDNLIHTPTNRLYGCTFLRYYLDKAKAILQVL
jgi:soluble lytic murein transglycosylase-like protein